MKLHSSIAERIIRNRLTVSGLSRTNLTRHCRVAFVPTSLPSGLTAQRLGSKLSLPDDDLVQLRHAFPLLSRSELLSYGKLLRQNVGVFFGLRSTTRSGTRQPACSAARWVFSFRALPPSVLLGIFTTITGPAAHASLRPAGANRFRFRTAWFGVPLARKREQER